MVPFSMAMLNNHMVIEWRQKNLESNFETFNRNGFVQKLCCTTQNDQCNGECDDKTWDAMFGFVVR